MFSPPEVAIHHVAEQLEETEPPAPARRGWLGRLSRPRGRHVPMPALPVRVDTETLFTPQELAAYERHRTRKIQQRSWVRKLGWAEIATWTLCVLPVLTACVYIGAHYTITHNEIKVVPRLVTKIRDVTHWREANGRVITVTSSPHAVVRDHLVTRTRTVTVTRSPQPQPTVTQTVTASPQPQPTVTVTVTASAPAPGPS